MASFDSIINVDEWISDYYLTTDEKKGESFSKRADAAIKQWKADDKASGAAVSPWGANDFKSQSAADRAVDHRCRCENQCYQCCREN